MSRSAVTPVFPKYSWTPAPTWHPTTHVHRHGTRHVHRHGTRQLERGFKPKTILYNTDFVRHRASQLVALKKFRLKYQGLEKSEDSRVLQDLVFVFDLVFVEEHLLLPKSSKGSFTRPRMRKSHSYRSYRHEFLVCLMLNLLKCEKSSKLHFTDINGTDRLLYRDTNSRSKLSKIRATGEHFCLLLLLVRCLCSNFEKVFS